MERQGFDDQWKKVFENAEASPSDGVWANIANDLERAGDVNRKLGFYKWVAAASVFFALAAGATGIYLFQQNSLLANKQAQLDAQRLADAKQIQGLAAELDATILPKEDNVREPGMDNELAKVDVAKRRTIILQSKREIGSEPIAQASVAPSSVVSGEVAASDVINGFSNEMLSNENDGAAIGEHAIESLPQIAFTPSNAYQNLKKEEEQNQDEVVAQLLAKLQQRENELKDAESKNKHESMHENVWSSIGFAAGSFNTRGATGISSAPQNQSFGVSQKKVANATSQEARANGLAYSVGFSVGKKVSARWIVQSGISYLNQSSNYTAESAFGNAQYQDFKPESINEYGKLNSSSALLSDTRVVKTAPYQVNNSVRYLTVPVQAGYLIVNARLGLQVNAGVSTDLFLQNTKTANGENLQKIDQEIGDADVPYKTMNFSGLVGSELSYRFGSRYRLALNPGVRYPFSSIYKSGLGVKSAPLTLDIGLRFRYIFH